MNPDHVHFADWDAAYVLGALSSADRRRFEEHVQDCRACQAVLAELAPMPGLLARVSRDRAMTMLESGMADAPDPGGRVRIVERGEREARDARRRRRTWWTTGIAAALALVVVVSVAVATAIVPGPRAGTIVALEPLVDAPITATVELTDVAWGTRIRMECRYAGGPSPGAATGGWPYVLVVIADDGTATELSTWRALPGATARLEAGTALDSAEIAAIEVRVTGGDRVLLRGSPAVGAEE